MRAVIRKLSYAGVMLALVGTLPDTAWAVMVTDLTDGAAGTPAGAGLGNAGDLRHAIINANDGDVIEFDCAAAPCTITLNGPLPPIRHNVTIDGGARGRIVIDGRNLYRAFFADTGTIAIRNLKIQNVRAKGGNGGDGGQQYAGQGGGGAGLGAGLFVAELATVTVTDVDFAHVVAVGGAGGNAIYSPNTRGSGGGGGLGGDGGSGTTGSSSGSGGGGVLGAGDANTASGAGAGGLGGGGGGGGGNPSSTNGAGGTGYGSGAAGAVGRNADLSGSFAYGAGGDGGFGGGGGAGPSFTGGSQSLTFGVAGIGGFGGGGGAGDWGAGGGAGGPGGGGGTGGSGGGAGGELMAGLGGGAGGGSSSVMQSGGGGGGAAAGAAIFVHLGSLTVVTSTVDGVTATGGAGGTNQGSNGQGATDMAPGTAGGADATPVFSYDGRVNGTQSRGPVPGVLIAPLQGVTATRAGNGSGTVTATAGGLNCPGTCTVDVAAFSDITLTATAASGSTFSGWSGDCSGTTAAFSFTNIIAAKACTATFLMPVAPAPGNPAPAPLPSFVAAPLPPAINAGTGGNGEGRLSLAAYFPNAAGITFTVAGASGEPLPSWLKFDPATASFIYQLSAPNDAPFADIAADSRRDGPNTIYPPVLRAAKLPVRVAASSGGQTYAVTVELGFFYPRNAGVIAAASLSLDGAAGNAPSGRSSLSFDGGQVVFETQANNLFLGSANAFTDIVRYHGLSGTRDRLSQTAIPGGGVANAADGNALNPATSADGRWAAFVSDAAGITLVPSGRVAQVYRASLVHPRVPLNEGATPTPDVVSITAAGMAGNGPSDNPAISEDGRYVAFDSTATNFAAGLDGTRRIWRKDLSTGDLALVAAGRNPSISWDGNWVAFEADGAVHLKNMTTGAAQIIGNGRGPKLSARGDQLVFASGNKVMLGGRAIADGDQPGISADGRFVVYRTAGQVRVMDMDRGATALVSQTAAGTAATGDSANPAISGDGSTIAFTSTARDLVGGNLAAGQLYLAANPLPLPERTGYWYQASAANGQGWVMERWGNKAYLGGLVYDGEGRATWMTGFCTQQDLSCQGQLSAWTGGTAFGAAGAGAPVPAAGPSFTVTTEGRQASLTVGKAAMALSPFPIGGTVTTAYAGVPQAGWWYEPASGNSGNGYFLGVNTQTTADGAVQQMVYLSIMTFDAQGRAVWYAAQGPLTPGLSAMLHQYGSDAAAIGEVRLTFDGSDRAVLNLPNGRTASLVRWRF